MDQDKEFWKFVRKTSKEVAKWPCWKRVGFTVNGIDWKKCKKLDCTICYDDRTARELLLKKLNRQKRKK